MPFDPMNPYAQIMGNTMDPLQVQPPAQPLQAPAQPQQPGFFDKLGGFLSHPAVQGLLGAYFGAVSSPRHGGLGMAIGNAGLGGLGMMNEAQAMQQRQQLLQQRAAQQGQLMGFKERELGAKEKQLGFQEQTAQANAAAKAPIGKPAAMRILQANPKMGIDADTLATFTTDQVRRELDAIRTTGQRDPLVASEIARNQAEAGAATKRVGIEGAGLGLREKELAQQKQLGEEGLQLKRQEFAAKANPPPKPVDPAQRAQRIAQVNALWQKNAPGIIARMEGNQSGYPAAHHQALVDAGATPEEATAMSGYTPPPEDGAPATSIQPADSLGAGGYGVSHASMPAHASTGEGLPPGSKPNGDGTWSLPDGTRVKPLG